MIFLTSAVPELVAEISTKRCGGGACEDEEAALGEADLASNRAKVVLPVPGGPQRIMDGILP